MKKFISVLMIVVVFVIVFNVCSNKDEVSTSNDEKLESIVSHLS